MISMTYDNLVRLQNAAQIVFALSVFGGLALLIFGLIRTRWVGMTKRRWVVLSTIGIWILGALVYGGTIAFTHAQPNGPHAFESYMDGVTARICIKDPAHPSCAELKKKCAERDPTHPSCRILAGEDPAKFYRTTVR